jgi:lipoprotein-releasing system permease protein
MNIEHFIAKRIALSKDKSFSKMIVRIAIAAIAISLTVMILTTAIIDGFKKEITEKIFGFWGHIHITEANVNRNFELIPIDKNDKVFAPLFKLNNISYPAPKTYLGVKFSDELYEKQSFGGIKGVHPYLITASLLNTKENFHGVLLKGIDKNYDWDRIKQFIVEGRQINFNDSMSSDIIISRNIAEKLKLKIGNRVVMAFVKDQEQIKKRFEIVGVYNTGLEEYDKRMCIVDIAKLQNILKWAPHQVQGMEVILDDVRDLDPISDHIYYEVLPQQYFAESIRAKFPSIFEWLNLQDINEKIILILMVVVAIINMITVLLILILERSHMIGVIKSLGMSNWQVRKIFIYNAAYIIGYGLLCGNIIGLGLAYIQKYTKFIKLDEASYYLDTAPIDIDLGMIIFLNIGVLLLTLTFLIIPTMLITRITPVKVLRFD